MVLLLFITDNFISVIYLIFTEIFVLKILIRSVFEKKISNRTDNLFIFSIYILSLDKSQSL